MKEYEYLDELISRYPVLAPVKADIRTAYETLKECYERGGKLLIAEMAEAVRIRSTSWAS
mgnify:CR=1 FL=1